jgi:hypothetical protein
MNRTGSSGGLPHPTFSVKMATVQALVGLGGASPLEVIDRSDPAGRPPRPEALPGVWSYGYHEGVEP